MLLALLALCAALARADVLYGIKKPVFESATFQAHPFLRLSELYNSNVLLEPRGGAVLSSWVHQVNAGFKTSLEPARPHRFELGYELEHQAFTKDPSANNALNHEAGFLYKYTGAAGLSATARDDYVNTVAPPNTERTERLRRWSNTGALQAEYQPGDSDAFVGAEASHAIHLYTDADPDIRALFNRHEVTLGARAGYRVLPQTRVYAAYRRGLIDYRAVTAPPTKNNKSHTFAGGLELDAAAKVQLRAEAGLHLRRYDDPPAPGGDLETRSVVASAGLSYLPLERTRLDLQARRAVEETAFGNNRFFTSNGATALLQHGFPIGLTLSLWGAYQRNSYPEAVNGLRRRDDVWQGRVLAEKDVYQDWVRLGASWLFRRRDSRQALFEYRGHVLGVTLSVVL